jgi:hypothetical protein
MPSEMNRREFLAGAATAATFTIVPRRVLGGAGFVAPSDRITLACIGFGTQAIREIGSILASPDVEVVAVCDVEKDGVNYLEWGRNQIRDGIRKLIENPTWREGFSHVPGGRDVGKEIVDTYYAKQRGTESSKGCATYVDFRELLEKEKDVTAVKVMTPDHTHAAISIAALKKGKNVIVHKPLANRLLEARAVIGAARAKQLATHFLPASEGVGQKEALDMVRNGAIGTLREIHNWSMRPMWPQFPTLPTDTPPVPAGFDWTLWLGPSLDRPYHPNYTHTNFRGWYEFGGGSIRMRFAAKRDRPSLDIFWYDGGIKPPVPEELMAESKELDEEGMMFVGDKGKILGGFRAEDSQLIPDAKMRAYRAANNLPEPTPPERGTRGDQDGRRGPSARDAAWIAAFKGGPASFGDFLLAGPICDAVNLSAISLRLGGRRLLWDSTAAKITNVPEANMFLTREYREGWPL